MSNDFKSQLSREFTKREKKRNEISELIILPYERPLTKEEEEQYLSLSEEDISINNILYTLYCMARKFIETGEVDEETFKKCMKAKPRKISLEEIKPEWEKEPSKINQSRKREGKENER